jgi:hypothetical protein
VANLADCGKLIAASKSFEEWPRRGTKRREKKQFEQEEAEVAEGTREAVVDQAS